MQSIRSASQRRSGRIGLNRKRNHSRSHSSRTVAGKNERALFAILFFSFAIVIGIFVDEQFRNYLLLGAIAGGAFALPFMRLRLGDDFALLAPLALLMISASLFSGVARDIWSTFFTLFFACGYLVLAGLCRKRWFDVSHASFLFGFLIQAFAVASLIQLTASVAGLPVPNLIASKGLWSYNSLAFEPSQLGRVVGIAMLAFLTLERIKEPAQSLGQLLRKNWRVCFAFFLTMTLSGSALSAASIVVVLALASGTTWATAVGAILLFAWPFLSVVEIEAVDRVVNLVSALPTLDITSIHKAEGSGALRVIPLVIYLEASNPQQIDWWLGSGTPGLLDYFLGKIPSMTDSATVGFLPGFAVFYGVLGFALFAWIYAFRLSSRRTAPLIIFWAMFVTFSAWNTQVFWFGLICIRIVYEIERKPHFRKRPVPR